MCYAIELYQLPEAENELNTVRLVDFLTEAHINIGYQEVGFSFGVDGLRYIESWLTYG